ncbi:MAG: hypothetical protein GWN94_14015 [Phycisphaerae bacterium]|nr:hypothetical protein [Phycisphaerae bacterium]
MADRTANCKGLARSRRHQRDEIGDGYHKGQVLRRYEIVSDTAVKGGHILVLASESVVATDTFTITVVAT